MMNNSTEMREGSCNSNTSSACQSEVVIQMQTKVRSFSFFVFFYFCHDHLSGILPKSHKKDFFFCFHGCLLRFLELCNEKPFLYFA